MHHKRDHRDWQCDSFTHIALQAMLHRTDPCSAQRLLAAPSVVRLGICAVSNCSPGSGDLQLAALVQPLSAQVAGLRLGRHFSIRDVIKWARRMQVRFRLCSRNGVRCSQ
jgi:hypothetical protein